MKPTVQNSRKSRLDGAVRPFVPQISQRPITDWSFQLSAPDLRGGIASLRRPGFHTLSQRFFSTEANRDLRFESALFAVIATSALWPIVLAVQAVAILLK